MPSTVPSRRLRVALSSLMEQNGHDQHGSRKRLAHEHQQNNATRLGAQRVGLGCAESEAKVRMYGELGNELEGEMNESFGYG